MDKIEILAEINRTALLNGGKALGWRRFEDQTGIGYYDWYGKHWASWGDAVRDAGLQPNSMSTAYTDDYLFEKLVLLSRSLGRVPTTGDLLLTAKKDHTFPSAKVFRRLVPKSEVIAQVISHCEMNRNSTDVVALWRAVLPPPKRKLPDETVGQSATTGYVYLLKHGTRREYKIGRTNNVIRREGEIRVQLPEQPTPVHYIRTDDPAGVENYWHNRFKTKRKEGEWFELSGEDVRAFKKWRRID